MITRSACKVIIITQTHVQTDVPLPSRLFVTLLETVAVSSGGLTGEQHKLYGLLCIRYKPGKGDLARVSCLLLGCSWTDGSRHPIRGARWLPPASSRLGSVRFDGLVAENWQALTHPV